MRRRSIFAIEYRALRELIRSTRGCEVEVTGKPLEWPELEVVPEEAVKVELPASFGALLALAGPVTDCDGARHILRGVNLPPKGITATHGRELLLDETGVLTRKVKEAVLKQKQKERDFILAKRAIERIKMAI